MPDPDLNADDLALIEAARDVLRRNYRAERHTVGAAVRCASGKVYAAVNVESCGYGPCAEPIAVGTAVSSGETQIVAVVAVCKEGDGYPVLSPCGNCRQLLLDYAPEATVIYRDGRADVKATAREMLPGAYRMFDE
jgi:cytidine deaminase